MALLTLQTIVDKAARRCGHLAEQLTTEQTQFMRENLSLLLSHESNNSLNLWKVIKYRHGITNGQLVYTMPQDMEYPLNINYVTGTIQTLTPTGQYNWPTSASPINCNTVGIKVAADQAAIIKLQYSTDNNTWVDAATLSSLTAGWNYFSTVATQPAGVYWRLASFIVFGPSGLSPVTFPASTVNFYSLISEIPMAPLNRDDYWNLPNKEFQANRPLQFWFDRQNTQLTSALIATPSVYSNGPQIRYWPVGNDETVHVSMLYGARISDVTNLSYDQQIDVPERWMNYVITALAAESALELPGVPPDRITMLEGKAMKLRQEVYDGETDGSPIYFSPNISHYTR